MIGRGSCLQVDSYAQGRDGFCVRADIRIQKKTKSLVVEKLKSKGVLDAHSKMECFAITSISYTTVLAVQVLVHAGSLILT